MLLECREVLLDRIVDAEIDHLEAGALEHHADEVLADVVHVALDRADDDLADGRDIGFGQDRAQNLHAAFHGVGGKQHLGNEQDAIAEIDADDAHALDEGFVQHLFGGPAAREKDPRARLDLRPQAVIEVVVHLLDQLCVVERVEVEFLAVGHSRLL